MDIFMNIPALLRVIIVFSMVLALNRFGLHLGLALLVGAMGMGLWFGLGFFHVFEIMVSSVFTLDCFLLLVLIFEILGLTTLMHHTGMMQKMITSIRGIVPSRRLGFALLPAMIGLLPMPGGAAVSAPMVDMADSEKKVPSVGKTAINYWFRHSCEFWWPLYPGVLLAFELSGLSVFHFAVVQMPLTLFSTGFGILFLLLPLKLGPKEQRPRGNIRDLMNSLSPIFVLLGFWLLTGKFISSAIPSKYLPMVIAILAAIIWLQILGKPGKEAWKDVFTKKKTYLLLVVVIGVWVFSGMLKEKLPGGGNIVDRVQEDLRRSRVPDLLVVMLMPFISGVVTGLGMGFVGASFPIVMSLAGDGANVTKVMSYVVLGYGFGYVGMMMSPVHVCFVVTNEFFRTRMLQSYLKLLGPALGVLAGSVIIAYIVSLFG